MMTTNLPKQIKQLTIRCFGETAGALHRPAQYRFRYDNGASTPCSMTMPIRDAAYDYGALHPIFAQNLPEGYVRRYISERLARHANVDDLYLLALQRENGIGHIGVQSALADNDTEQLSLDDILNWRGQTTIFPELLERFYLRGALSGMQPKVMVPIEGRGTLPQQDLIVKSHDAEFERLTVNEFVCMSAADACGLGPPRFWLSDDLTTFVVARFDRLNGEKIGIEDFTVLMGRAKYQGSYETLLKAVSDYTKDAQQVANAYRLIVFNCLIGNGDAHLKNFALQYRQHASLPTLAPPYDITHTLIYPTVDGDMALKIKGARSFPDQSALTQLGHDTGIRKPERIVEELADRLSTFIRDFEAVRLLPGLQQSIGQSISRGAGIDNMPYRRDRTLKYPLPRRPVSS